MAFYIASSRGTTSFFFADLQTHSYTPLVRPWLDQRCCGLPNVSYAWVVPKGMLPTHVLPQQASLLGVCCARSSAAHAMQDVPGGAAVEESIATFPSMESALWHPWKLLHQKWTHKLVYVLRGTPSSLSLMHQRI